MAVRSAEADTVGHDLQHQVATWKQQGFVTIPEALSAGEVGAMRSALDADRAAYPNCWEMRGMDHGSKGIIGEGGRWQSEPLPRTDAFDGCIAHPNVLPLLRELMGPQMRLASLSLMVREPVYAPVPEGQDAHWQLWHREGGGAANPGHPNCIHTMMVLFYLHDSDHTTHGFSVVPESLATKKAHTLRQNKTTESWYIDEPFMGQSHWRSTRRCDSVDVHGKAGTAVVTNGSNPHAGTVRQCNQAYAKVLLWYTFGPQYYCSSSIGRQGPKITPHHSAHGDKEYIMPRRLWENDRISWLLEAAESDRDDNGLMPNQRVSPAEELPKESLQPTLAAAERVNTAKRLWVSDAVRIQALTAIRAAAKL